VQLQVEWVAPFHTAWFHPLPEKHYPIVNLQHNNSNSGLCCTIQRLNFRSINGEHITQLKHFTTKRVSKDFFVYGWQRNVHTRGLLRNAVLIQANNKNIWHASTEFWHFSITTQTPSHTFTKGTYQPWHRVMHTHCCFSSHSWIPMTDIRLQFLQHGLRRNRCCHACESSFCFLTHKSLVLWCLQQKLKQLQRNTNHMSDLHNETQSQ
jgi:hypothetical protein